jgi:hypothetical protein
MIPRKTGKEITDCPVLKCVSLQGKDEVPGKGQCFKGEISKEGEIKMVFFLSCINVSVDWYKKNMIWSFFLKFRDDRIIQGVVRFNRGFCIINRPFFFRIYHKIIVRPVIFQLKDKTTLIKPKIKCFICTGVFTSSPEKNPRGPSSGKRRVIRGGCWFVGPDFCRVSARGSIFPDVKNCYLGFRIVRTK